VLILFVGPAYGLLSTARTTMHPTARMPRQLSPRLPATSLCATPAEAEQPEAEPSGTPFGRARAWVGKYAKFDKAKIASLGFDAFFTYGLVSNANGGWRPTPCTHAQAHPHAHPRRSTQPQVNARCCDPVCPAGVTIALAWGTFCKGRCPIMSAPARCHLTLPDRSCGHH
jgi:hypothetical protein